MVDMQTATESATIKRFSAGFSGIKTPLPKTPDPLADFGRPTRASQPIQATQTLRILTGRRQADGQAVNAEVLQLPPKYETLSHMLG